MGIMGLLLHHPHHNLLLCARHSLKLVCSNPLPPPNSKPYFSLKRSFFPLRTLLALSAAAAFVVIRKRVRYFQKLSKARASMDPASRPPVFDSHLHVWAPLEQADDFPYFPGQEPTIPGSVEVLLEEMRDNLIKGALIVQPINYKFDHSYVSSVLQRYPGIFVGCCLADPTEGGGGARELERLVTEEGYRAVRFNPYLWPSDQKMTNTVGKAMFAKAGQLGIPVGFMCFKGLLLHIAEIEELCSEFTGTTVLIDHLGFCKPPKNESDLKAWKYLLNLANFPNVFVKVSAFFRVSREQFPYKDTWPLLKELIATFGAQRLLWGSDFPFVVGECGYANAKKVLDLAKESISISDGDMELIMGGAALNLFQDGWIE